MKSNEKIRTFIKISFILSLFLVSVTASYWYVESNEELEFGEYIYTSSNDGTVRKIEKETGNLEWIYEGHSDGVFSVTVDEKYIYTSSRDGTIRKLNKDSTEVWITNITERIEGDIIPTWSTMDEDYLYFLTGLGDDGDIVAKMNKENKEIEWIYNVEEAGYGYTGSGGIAVDDSKVYFGARDTGWDGYLVALNKETAEEEFAEFLSGYRIRRMFNKEGYIYTGHVWYHRLIKWDIKGNKEWTQTTFYEDVWAVSADDNYAYGRHESYLRMLNDETGSSVTTWYPSDRPQATQSDNEHVFVGDDNGMVYSLDTDDDFNVVWGEQHHSAELRIYSISNEVVLTIANPFVITKEPENITHDSAILKGELEDLGDLEEAELWVHAREKGQESWVEENVENSSKPTEFNWKTPTLKSDTTYEYKVVAKGEVNETKITKKGEIEEFRTSTEPGKWQVKNQEHSKDWTHWTLEKKDLIISNGSISLASNKGKWTSKIWDDKFEKKSHIDNFETKINLPENSIAKVRIGADTDKDESIDTWGNWIELQNGTNTYTKENINLEGYQYQIQYNLTTGSTPKIHNYTLKTQEKPDPGTLQPTTIAAPGHSTITILTLFTVAILLYVTKKQN